MFLVIINTGHKSNILDCSKVYCQEFIGTFQWQKSLKHKEGTLFHIAVILSELNVCKKSIREQLAKRLQNHAVS